MSIFALIAVFFIGGFYGYHRRKAEEKIGN